MPFGQKSTIRFSFIVHRSSYLLYLKHILLSSLYLSLSTASRNSCVARKRHCPSGTPGRFIRASSPNPSISCTGSIAKKELERHRVSIMLLTAGAFTPPSPQLFPSKRQYLRANSLSSSDAEYSQPRSVSLS